MADVRALIINDSSGEIEEYQDGTTVDIGKVFGKNFQETSRNDFQNTTNVPVTYLSYTTTSLPAATYRIGIYYVWSCNISSNDIIVQPTIDGDLLYNPDATDGNEGLHRQEPKDAAGSGNGGTDQRHNTSAFFYKTLTAGTHDIEIEFVCGNNNTVTIHQARVVLWRVSGGIDPSDNKALIISDSQGEVEEYQTAPVDVGFFFGDEFQFAEETTFDTTPGQTEQTFLTLNTTNVPAGNYFIEWFYIWSFDSITEDFRARVTLDGSNELYNPSALDGNQGFHIQEPKDSAGSGNGGTNQRHVVSHFSVQSLTAGTHSIAISYGGSSNATAAMHHAIIGMWRID